MRRRRQRGVAWASTPARAHPQLPAPPLPAAPTTRRRRAQGRAGQLGTCSGRPKAAEGSAPWMTTPPMAPPPRPPQSRPRALRRCRRCRWMPAGKRRPPRRSPSKWGASQGRCGEEGAHWCCPRTCRSASPSAKPPRWDPSRRCHPTPPKGSAHAAVAAAAGAGLVPGELHRLRARLHLAGRDPRAEAHPPERQASCQPP
mmetsp:Transcript_4704/g.13514  ORF Transcript_4704/g.13514 Transcript_4704/m.13514 type:complete len:200 (-) Transcript_4704:336-935(-)